MSVSPDSKARTKKRTQLIITLSVAAVIIAGAVLSIAFIGNSTPAENITAPTDASTIPTEATVAPTEASAAPTEATISPTEASAAPTEKSTAAPTEATTASATQKPAPATAAPTKAPTQPPTSAPTQPPKETTPPDYGNLPEYDDNGELLRSTIVGSAAEGYYYVNGSGERDYGYCNALTIAGVDWNIIEGRATRVNNSWDACLHSALKYVGKCTNSSMTRAQKLRSAFDYIKRDDVFLEGVLHDPPYRKADWPVVCANDLFKNGMGDCFSYGAAFAFMAKGIGYENCYACNSGGHGWAEINGKAYDPEWDMHHQEYNHFGVSPGDRCDVAYFSSLMDGVAWMYVRV